MKTAKQFFLEAYLPSTSQEMREDWFRNNRMAQEAVIIMEVYARSVIDEIVDHPSKYVCGDKGNRAFMWNSSVEDLKKSLK